MTYMVQEYMLIEGKTPKLGESAEFADYDTAVDFIDDVIAKAIRRFGSRYGAVKTENEIRVVLEDKTILAYRIQECEDTYSS